MLLENKFDEMIAKDLDLMWLIQDFCHRSLYAHRIEGFMNRVVSKVR
jgi:hypothetical protein